MISSKKGIIISLFDYTGLFVNPWLDAGYTAIIVDLQHENWVCQDVENHNLYRIGMDLREGWKMPIPDNVVFIAGFPPCTHTAVSGARHFISKGVRALSLSLDLFATTKELAETVGCPFLIEHPVSTIKSYAGKCNYSFNPYEYGGYLPKDDVHPKYPEYIKARDAYPKTTQLWTGNGFVMPPKKPVHIDAGNSTQYLKLGGKSQKTKNIRSATPRGFAKAVFMYNNPDVIEQHQPQKEMNLFNI